MDDKLRFARREVIEIRKWNTEDTDRDPDDIVVSEAWIDADGKEVTDPDRIAELEREVP